MILNFEVRTNEMRVPSKDTVCLDGGIEAREIIAAEESVLATSLVEYLATYRYLYHRN